MFFLSVLLYPCLLGVLCLGGGLLVDRLAGGFLPGAMLVAVGVAAMIGLSQLASYLGALAPATPYLMAAAALAGLVLARERLRTLAGRARAHPAPVLVAALAYLAAIAPVLLAGRPTFSSFMALSDSAVHMIGADYLIHHGQSYGHLDLRNSYGQFIVDYYDSGYPSGADTLFGGSALLAHLPLIWTFQPLCAFLLAVASGPALVLARQMRIPGRLSALAALTAVLGALVYGYELVGSVKEIAALAMVLAGGALVALHPRWLREGPRAGIPLALVLAAGISALGVAFGVWALAALAVLAVVLAGELRAGRIDSRAAVRLISLSAAVGLAAALPTLTHLLASFRVAGNIASTSNPGNLRVPLHTIQVAGSWLSRSYKLRPAGSDLAITHALVAVTLAAAVLGAARLLRARSWPLAGWFATTLLAWLIIAASVTTWASAKALVLSSPLIVLLAWGGVALLGELPRRALARSLAALVAVALVAGMLVSDAMQYRASNLAPTARYRELASVDSRFAGGGPTLFGDFDEYALYVLRHLDIGGPDFVYPPPALAAAAGGYGRPVDLDRIPPHALAAYPLIVTRREPWATRPPAAYRLAWQGAYYQVWRRRPGVPPALAHRPLSGDAASQCRQIAHLVGERRRLAGAAPGLVLAAARAPEVVQLELAAARRPRGWGRERAGLTMGRPGTLTLPFSVPAAGVWKVWVKGQIMPAVAVGLDGRPLYSIEGQLGGNSLVTNTAPPAAVALAAGPHTLSISRRAATLAPGELGSAFLAGVLLTPAGAPPQRRLRRVPISAWRGLCGTRYQWVELLAS